MMNDCGQAAPWLYLMDPTAYRMLRRRFLRAQLEILEGLSDVVKYHLEDVEKDETPRSEKIIIE
jgi:hypothetical protein